MYIYIPTTIYSYEEMVIKDILPTIVTRLGKVKDKKKKISILFCSYLIWFYFKFKK